MAVVFSPSSLRETSAETRAVSWTAISAGIALIGTVPLVLVLLQPVSSVLFIRGNANDGSWMHALTMILVLLAPATYTLFFGTTSELLKTRVSDDVRRTTVRFAALAMVPYFVLVTLGVFWESGPAQMLMTVGALTIPIAMAATTWISGQH